MASIIDFTNFTFTDEQIRDLNELMYLERIQTGMFSEFHQVVTGIKSGKEIGWIGKLGAIGKVSRGCSPVSDTNTVPGVKKVWSPKEFDTRLEECWKDLQGKMSVYSLKNGTERQDLTSTTYMSMLSDLLGEAFESFMWRLWLMDTAADHVGAGEGGIITDGVDLTLLQIVDGYWKQIAAIVAANPTQQTVVAANNEATYALQNSALTHALALQYLQDATYNMPVELVRQPNKMGLITRYFANQAKRAFQAVNTHPDAYMAMIDGVEVLKVNGVDFVIIDEWDLQIKEYNDLGAAWFKPHRAVITTKENLAFGIESEGSFGTFDVFHDKTLRKTFVDMIDSVDVKVMQDKLIHVIY